MELIKMRNIIVERARSNLVRELPFEMVERKGSGHPDTLIDDIMENVSASLSREYIKKFGRIRHHNVDKGLICGGTTEVEYMGGRFVNPIRVILSGRAYGDIPVEDIAVQAARDCLTRSVRNLNLENVQIDSTITEIWPTWDELSGRGDIPLANDTSFGVGYAPFTETERLVLGVEQYFNSDGFKRKYSWIGEDIKVMGLRTGEATELTIAAALVSKYIGSLGDYVEAKKILEREATEFARKTTDKKVSVMVNHADNEEAGSVYLTLSGTSAEMGDDGSVGRGNRANGLITPCRPMTLEAIAGKNPVSHTGKIYSILAFDIAERVVREFPEVENADVYLLSRIGQPIDHPKNASVMITADSKYFDSIQRGIRDIVDEELSQVTSLSYRLVR
jgi:S-adenosylmethionine synthetase